ncbi:MAG: hypothetical protein HYW88_00580 [Candidatus Sungbacteria bacterium]|nr:hypothetical protein [Candidatus Sungbacteria bacterium]
MDKEHIQINNIISFEGRKRIGDRDREKQLPKKGEKMGAVVSLDAYKNEKTWEKLKRSLGKYHSDIMKTAKGDYDVAYRQIEASVKKISICLIPQQKMKCSRHFESSGVRKTRRQKRSKHRNNCDSKTNRANMPYLFLSFKKNALAGHEFLNMIYSDVYGIVKIFHVRSHSYDNRRPF